MHLNLRNQSIFFDRFNQSFVYCSSLIFSLNYSQFCAKLAYCQSLFEAVNCLSCRQLCKWILPDVCFMTFRACAFTTLILILRSSWDLLIIQRGFVYDRRTIWSGEINQRFLRFVCKENKFAFVWRAPTCFMCLIDSRWFGHVLLNGNGLINAQTPRKHLFFWFCKICDFSYSVPLECCIDLLLLTFNSFHCALTIKWGFFAQSKLWNYIFWKSARIGFVVVVTSGCVNSTVACLQIRKTLDTHLSQLNILFNYLF